MENSASVSADLRPTAGVRVLIVDDHDNMVESLALTLRHAGYDVTGAHGGEAALTKLAGESFDVVITDLRMDKVDGLAVLRRAVEASSITQVVLMTAFGTFDGAVEAIKAGAYWYIPKPFSDDQLLFKVARAAEKVRLLKEVRQLSDEFHGRQRLENVLGNSPAMHDLLARVAKAAPTDATILITGERGSGRELVARAIHAASRRAEGPFVAVNCTAFPEPMLEGELFGQGTRRGLFEDAAGGTIYFEDIARTTLAFQTRLLQRIGGDDAIKVDARIIAGVSMDLRAEVAAQRFREDLFFRLNVVPMRIPPLRDRPADIALLAGSFLRRFDDRNRTTHRFSDGALTRLAGYEFPGNVRELENLVEQAAALAAGEEILPSEVLLDQPDAVGGEEQSLAQAVDRAERQAIEQAIGRSGGDLRQVAQQLRVSSTTLWRKMKRLTIIP